MKCPKQCELYPENLHNVANTLGVKKETFEARTYHSYWQQQIITVPSNVLVAKKRLKRVCEVECALVFKQNK